MTTKKVHDIATGEVIESPLTNQELQELEVLKSEFTADKQARQAAAEARKMLLDKLGLTEEEARLLLGGN